MRFMKAASRWRQGDRAQAMVEFALVFPVFILVLLSIIVLGLYVFYNQQLQGAAAEAARYAAVHSSTAQCPTVSRINPILRPASGSYFRCDAPEESPPWPDMTAAARSKVWGMNPNSVYLMACWSGYVRTDVTPPKADQLSTAPGAKWQDCTINRINPQSNPGALSCPPPATIPSAGNADLDEADGDDKASNLAADAGTGVETHYPTRITVYACFNWTPPMAGFVMIPSQITLRSVVTEALQRQQ